MATISTESIRLKTGTPFKKVVTYSKSYFRIKLPDELCADMNYLRNEDKEVYGNSEDEVNSLFNAKVKEWDSAIEVVKRVILFRAEFQGALLPVEKFQSWYKVDYKPVFKAGTSNSMSQGCWLFCHEDMGSDKSLGLSIVWAVYDKKDVKGKCSYHFVRGREVGGAFGLRNNSSIGYTEIEHTQQREDFFMGLDETFAKMIANVYKALGDLTPEKLTALSESGMNILAPAKAQETASEK